VWMVDSLPLWTYCTFSEWILLSLWTLLSVNPAICKFT
jgi:hypothetical protein